jgi:hypothetical protein
MPGRKPHAGTADVKQVFDGRLNRLAGKRSEPPIVAQHDRHHRACDGSRPGNIPQGDARPHHSQILLSNLVGSILQDLRDRTPSGLFMKAIGPSDDVKDCAINGENLYKRGSAANSNNRLCGYAGSYLQAHFVRRPDWTLSFARAFYRKGTQNGWVLLAGTSSDPL